MFKIKTALRMAFFVTMIVGGNLWMAMMVRIAPRQDESLSRERFRQAQALGGSVAALAESGRIDRLRTMLEQLRLQDNDLVSVGIRRNIGGYRLEIGPHRDTWTGQPGRSNEISIEIQANRSLWGHLELCYGEQQSVRGILGRLTTYPGNFILFVSSSTCLLSWMLFSRIFRYLDPAKVVPGRVRSALDTLAEGLVLLDPSETIVHANDAFGRMLDVDPTSLIGQRLDLWLWRVADRKEASELPWQTGLRTRQEQNGVLLHLEVGKETRKYLVNANPILTDQGTGCRGALISFDDVTLLERKKQDLAETIESLRHSRDEIHLQNRKLRFLASRDPLTSCFNRRSFWKFFEGYWKSSPNDRLNVLMVDIDHFKSINDNHGHSTGDAVLRETGAILMHLVGRQGLVCRFGGEEFSVLLPNLDLSTASDVANAIHTAFQHCRVGGLEVTASIGLSNRMFGAMDAQHLLDQADQCLYAAKRNGRNQVVRFDQLQTLSAHASAAAPANVELHERVPFTTVSALFSTFARLHESSAAQLRGVADLCLAVGRPFLFRRQVFWLESAALLQRFGQLVATPTAEDARSRENGWEIFSAAAGQSRHCLRKVVGDCEIAELLGILADRNRDLLVETPESHTLEAAALVLGLCNLRLLARSGQAPAEEAEWSRLVQEHPPSSDSGQLVPGILQQILECEPALEQVDQGPLLAPEVVATIERYHDHLNLAIAGHNKSKLGQATASILREFPEMVDEQVTRMVDQLDSAARQRDPAFDELAELADEILDLCRYSRRSLQRIGAGTDARSSLPDPVPGA